MKKILPILGLATAMALNPLNSDAQTSKNIKPIKDKTQSELAGNFDKTENIFDKNNNIIYTKENHDKIVNMSVESLQLEYKDKFEILFNYYMLEEINLQRSKLGLANFVWDDVLSEMCNRYNQYMSSQNKRGHRVNGKTSQDMGVNTDNYMTLHENITYDSNKANIYEIVQNWLYFDQRSGQKIDIDHNKAIICDDSDRFGSGIIFGERKNIYVTMNSGKKFH